MELNICHLYPELLNMYGDIGNILILKSRAAARGIDVKVINYSVGDTFDSENTDIVMFGGGQDFEMSVVEQDIKDRIIGDMRMYIETGGVLLAICGGYQMLGKYYVTPEGEKLEGLGILNHYTEGGDTRLIGNIATDIDGYTAIGFENHAGRTYIGDMQPLGKVIKGFGNNGEDGGEGLRYKNTYCTYLHGPFLSKNPKIADEMISAALKRKYGDISSLTPLDDEFESSARRVMQKRMEV
ncbi:MAG: glutamine amidotransferase [Clostridia bacterium]|nr:glutamine amidotransferase [Clostridia bacterium]